jgi:serine/threonine protein kinase
MPTDYVKGDLIGGRYFVEDIIGEGGYGLVFRVREIQSDKIYQDDKVYALKTFKNEFALNEIEKDRFRNEVLTWITLGGHRAIIQAYQVHDFDGRLFVAMDYISPDECGRPSLYDYISHEEEIGERLICAWMMQLCDGMEYAYSKGLIAHRDIKPMNMLIDGGAFLKIADFGLATTISDAVQDRRGRESRTVSGTTGYIAPELFFGEQPNKRSDIYSFGALLWQLAASSDVPPLVPTMRDFRETHHWLVEAEIPVVETPYWDVIRRCLEPRPEERFSHFTEVRASIKEAYARSGGSGFDFILGPVDPVTTLCNKAVNLKALGQFESALVCYEEAIQHQPTDAILWNNKGNLLASMNRGTHALEAYENAVRLNPNDKTFVLNKGIHFQSSNLHQRAMECFSYALRLDPTYDHAWRKLGQSQLALGMIEDSIRSHLKAVDFGGDDPKNWSGLAECYVENREFQNSIDCYDHALAKDRHCNSARVGRGRALLDLKRPEEAISNLEAALAVDPDDASAINYKGIALCRMHRPEEAIALFDRLLKSTSQETAIFWTNKGIALVELERWHEALPCFERALEINPEYAPASGMRSWLLANPLGDHQNSTAKM